MNYIPRCITKLHPNIIPASGAGSLLYADGTAYLDMTGGIGVLSVGHCHPKLVKGLQGRLDKLMHAPQMLWGAHPSLIDFNNRLINTFKNTDINRIFHVNSGSEATDNAIKVARKYTNKPNIISIQGGFHGRTYGALSVSTSSILPKKGCHPLVPGTYVCEPTIEMFDQILQTVSDTDDTAAVIVESIQGEGGIHSLDCDFLKYVETVCNDNNMLLIADEVQCGVGRTGEYWNILSKNINPHIITYAKGIGGGFPVAGLATKDYIIDDLSKGCLAGTYGGGALACEAGARVLEIIEEENILDNVKDRSKQLKSLLQQSDIPIVESRIYGLMCGIDFQAGIDVRKVVSDLRDRYVLTLMAGTNTLRLLPPLNIEAGHIERFVEALDSVFKNK